jgi:hypothetical protein
VKRQGKQEEQKGQERQKELFAFFALLALFASSLFTMPGHCQAASASQKFLRNIYFKKVPVKTE